MPPDKIKVYRDWYGGRGMHPDKIKVYRDWYIPGQYWVWIVKREYVRAYFTSWRAAINYAFYIAPLMIRTK